MEMPIAEATMGDGTLDLDVLIDGEPTLGGEWERDRERRGPWMCWLPAQPEAFGLVDPQIRMPLTLVLPVIVERAAWRERILDVVQL